MRCTQAAPAIIGSAIVGASYGYYDGGPHHGQGYPGYGYGYYRPYYRRYYRRCW